jgi:hypothetical protein
LQTGPYFGVSFHAATLAYMMVLWKFIGRIADTHSSLLAAPHTRCRFVAV